MIRELEEARQLFEDADTALQLLVAPICKRFGVTEERIKDEMEVMFRSASNPSD